MTFKENKDTIPSCIDLERDVISLTGNETKDFLQSLITNDINEVSYNRSIYTCFLNPQGKYNFDFFISLIEDKYLIDLSKTQTQEMIKKLKLYKLRKKIDIELESLYKVISMNGGVEIQQQLGYTEKYLLGIKYIDPRSSTMGYRAIISEEDINNTKAELEPIENYNIARINAMIPEGNEDMIFDKSFPLEFGLDRFNAISFTKGCYIGQEVTSRMKYRGVIRKRIYKINAEFVINKGEEIYFGEYKIGNVTSSNYNIGLALIREEDYNNLKMNQDLYPMIKNYKIELIS